MPEQIDSLFVRLGLEQDEQEFRRAESGFNSLRSTALQFGAAIGAGLGLNELTAGFSQTVNEANKLSDVFAGLEVTPQFVSNLQGAFRLIDEDASEAFSTINSLADLIEDADWGEISESAFARGFDPRGIQNAESMTEALASLNEQIQGMGNQENARRLASALGLSDAQFRLMRDTDVGQQMARAEEFSPLTQEMSDAARQFQEGAAEFSLAMEGVSNIISEEFAGELGETLSGLAETIKDNREFIREALPYLEATAAGIATLVAIQGGKKGFAALGGMALARRIPVIAAVAGSYSFLQDNPDYFETSIDQLKAPFRGKPAGVQRGMTRKEYENRGSEIPVISDPDAERRSLEEWQRLDSPLSFNRPRGGNTTMNLSIDARGSTDPQATEQAVERAVDRALARAAENTVNDVRSAVS